MGKPGPRGPYAQSMLRRQAEYEGSSAALKAEHARRMKVVRFRAALETRRKNARVQGINARATRGAHYGEASILPWFEGQCARVLLSVTLKGDGHATEVETSVSMPKTWHHMPQAKLESAIEKAARGAMLAVGILDEDRIPAIIEQALSTKGI